MMIVWCRNCPTDRHNRPAADFLLRTLSIRREAPKEWSGFGATSRLSESILTKRVSSAARLIVLPQCWHARHVSAGWSCSRTWIVHPIISPEFRDTDTVYYEQLCEWYGQNKQFPVSDNTRMKIKIKTIPRKDFTRCWQQKAARYTQSESYISNWKVTWTGWPLACLTGALPALLLQASRYLSGCRSGRSRVQSPHV